MLLDRDGTLIRDVPFLNDPAQVELLPGVGEGLAALQAAGFALAIVTNQQGVGLGYTTRQEMIAVNQRLFRELAPFGVLISRVYYCPHTAADHCDCRKPGTAMLRRAPSTTFACRRAEPSLLEIRLRIWRQARRWVAGRYG